MFDLLRNRCPDVDLYRLLRTGGPEERFSLPEVHNRIAVAIEVARQLSMPRTTAAPLPWLLGTPKAIPPGHSWSPNG